MTFIELIQQHNELYPQWEKAIALYHEAHNAIMCWRIDDKTTGMVKVDDTKTISGICGMDRGLDLICDYFTKKLPAQSTAEELERDRQLEAAIDALREAVNALEAFSEYNHYRQASDAENVLYWQIIEIEKAILEYPATDTQDVIAKARFMVNRDWSEGLENLEVFEHLLTSFQAISEHSK